MADSNQELDLDQLDKAVSALMDQATKKKSAPSPQKPASDPTPEPVKVISDAPVLPPATTPTQDDADDDGAVKVTVKRPMPQINRSRGTHGRAMDVIAAKPEPKPALHVPKREAPTLQPTGPITVEPPKPVVKEPTPLSAADSQSQTEPSDDLLASIDMKDDKPQPTEQHTLTHHKSDMPDPLDVHGFNDEPIKDSDGEPVTDELDRPAQEQKEPIEEPKPEASQPEESGEPDTAAESGTPFVKADVEKRPLGAYAAEPAEEKTAEPPAEDKLETGLDLPKEPVSSRHEDAPNPSTLPPQTPKELSPEVVAVESSEPEHIPTDTTDMQQLGQMSIPQQYQADDKSSSTVSRPVFDTKDYHPPIEAHARSHRGIGSAVMLILFILILGGVLAVAYFVITGSVDLGLLFG